MRASATIKFGLLACVLSAVFCATRPSAGANPPADVRAQAERLWEQAVEAKGGRARLRAVRNFVAASNSRYQRSPRPDVAAGISEESLYVLPGRWWSFWDYRPGRLGYGVNVFDFDKQVGWLSSDGRQASRLDRQDIFDDFLYRFRRAQFVYLLETESVKPTPVNARTAYIGFKKFDVVETTVDGARVDFYLDRETHLPVRIMTGATPGARRSGRLNYGIDLGDYAEIEGVRMPQKVNWADASNRTTYRFNVEYRAGLFERPPAPGSESNGWAAGR
jgi:hypothetical protein